MEADSYSNAKLKSLPRGVRDVVWRMRFPVDEDEKKFSYAEILAWLKTEHGVESSPAAMTAYFRWEKMNHDIESSVSAAEQAKLEFAMKYPDATPETLQGLGQLVFTSRAMQTEDLEGFVKLMDAWERRQSRLMQEDIWKDKKEAARRKRETEDAIRRVKEDKTLNQEEQRAAIVEKMDEFFGLKKSA